MKHKALQARLRACLFPWQRQTEKSANAAGNSQQLSAKMQIMLSFARIVRQLLQKWKNNLTCIIKNYKRGRNKSAPYLVSEGYFCTEKSIFGAL